MKITRNHARTIFALLLFTVIGHNHAMTVLPLKIETLYEQAADIVVAEATSSTSSIDAGTGLTVTYTTFNVLDAIKGNASGKYTIKQIGGRTGGSQSGLLVPGVPSFNNGSRYILFIPPTSDHGFASPVGLSQGRFSLTSIDGKTMVSNGQDMTELLSNITPDAMPAGMHEILASMPDKSTTSNRVLRSRLPVEMFVTMLRKMK